MSLESLGSKDVWVDYKWTEFGSIDLKRGKRYHLELSIVSFSEIEDGTAFRVAYLYKIKGGSFLKRIEPDSYRIDKNTIGVVIEIPDIVDEKMPVKFLVKRYSFYSELSVVQKVNVTLKLDPKLEF